MKVGTGRDKYPVVIKISFYPLTNKSPVIYLFGEIHVNAKIDSHLQKQNKNLLSMFLISEQRKYGKTHLSM